MSPTAPALPRQAPAELAPKQLGELLALAHLLADASGQVIRRHFRAPLAVADKSGAEGTMYDPVTVADRDAETAISSIEGRLRIRAETMPIGLPASTTGTWRKPHSYIMCSA